MKIRDHKIGFLNIQVCVAYKKTLHTQNIMVQMGKYINKCFQVSDKRSEDKGLKGKKHEVVLKCVLKFFDTPLFKRWYLNLSSLEWARPGNSLQVWCVTSETR